MKNLVLIPLIISGYTLSAQTINKPKDRVKAIGADHTNSAMDRKINQGFDKVEEGIGGLFKKKKKKENSENQATKDEDGGNGEGSETNDNPSAPPSNPSKPASFKAYSKYDFVSGEKVMALDDFSTTEIGDFPATWNTNSSGEIVTLEGQQGRWLKIEKEGVTYPEYITNLPENFTLEFDMACNHDFSYYSAGLGLAMAAIPNPGKDFVMWKQFGIGERNGVLVSFHPLDAGSGSGTSEFNIYNRGEVLMTNHVTTSQFHTKSGAMAKVSVWRQKSRLRVYLNNEKIWDLPKAFAADQKYNTLVFTKGGSNQPHDQFLIRNLRLAVGAPDTRSKLITEGRFVTTGILFDVNSDKIRPESYGVLKSVSQVLTENPEVKVKIVGHTDSDGDDAANLSLSRKRAESVKGILGSEFGISTDRFQTDGKGETQPADKNDTSVGKANNRRVEFIKL